MRVVGLDLSLRATGVATSGATYTLSSQRRGVERLDDLRSSILAACLDAELVVIEDYAYSRSGAHAHELGELGGVVRLSLWDAGRAVAVVGPSSLKMFATGKGNANKTDMAVAAYKTSGQEFKDDNTCDAWWLCQMGLYRHGWRGQISVTAYRDNAVSKVAWPELARAAS